MVPAGRTIKLEHSSSNKVKCHICRTFVYSGSELKCSVHDCEAAYHLDCAKKSLRASFSRKFRCPQHVSYVTLFSGLIICKDVMHVAASITLCS